MVISLMCILLTTSCITAMGQGEPAMMPVRMWEKSVLGKSSCSSMAMNMVGTPWKAVIRSLLMQLRAGLGLKYGRGRMVAPWVMEAVMASTMPKQWNMGTWIIMRSAVERSMRSPMFLPLFTMLWWVSMTPLGKPVVPEVYCMLATS